MLDTGRKHASSDRRKRKAPQPMVIAACAQCRRSKMRCDGTRPACGRCTRATIDCTYETEADETRWQAHRRRLGQLQTTHRTAHDSLSWLASQSPATITACLQQLDGAADAVDRLCTVVATRRSQLIGDNISPIPSIIAASPCLHGYSDLKLTYENPQSYPWLSVQDYLNLASNDGSTNDSTGMRSVGSTSGHYNTSLHIDFWTTVPIPAGLAAHLLDLYFRVEHPIYGFFAADVFAEDLFSCSTRHCSSLLVTSILLWTCTTYAPLIPQALAFREPLLASVNVLLTAERDVPSLSTIAALMIFALSSICSGEDEAAKRHMISGITMAEALHLVGESRLAIEHFTDHSLEDKRMLSYVAWAAFNFSTVYTMHFHDLESGTFTKAAPLLPLPEPIATPSMTGSMTLSGRDNASFPYFCQFWCIAHEIATVYFAKPEPLYKHVPLAYAESKHRRLLAWANALPEGMTGTSTMSHDVAEMHICYHATIMDLFRPFLVRDATSASSAERQRRLQSTFVLSFNHLRAKTQYYHTTFAQTEYSHTIAWIHGPLYIASAIISYEHTSSQKLSFTLVMQAFKNLVASHTVVAAFVKSLYGMAVSAKVITAAEAKIAWTDISMPLVEARAAERPKTGVVIDQNLAMNDLKGASGDKLAQAFDEMMLFNDYTDLDPTDKTVAE